jgi:hypothetical protein
MKDFKFSNKIKITRRWGKREKKEIMHFPKNWI